MEDLSGRTDAGAYLKSGLRDLQSGARQLAVNKFTKAIQLDPSFALAYEARATALCQMTDYADAMKDCDKALSLAHHDEHVYVIEGACRYRLHDIPGALKSLNTAISMDPNDSLAWTIRGVTLAESRQWDDASADFSKAIGLDPEDAMAYYGRATVECFLDDYEKSLANVSHAIQLDRTLSDAYGLRSYLNAYLKDRAGAFADANTRIQLDTSHDNGYAFRDEGYVDRAHVEEMWDDFSDASNDLKTAILINPTNSEIYLCRGTLEQKCGNFQAALADFNRSLIYDPDSIDAPITYESIGYDHAETGQWQAALESFRKAMAFKSQSDDVRFEIFLIECHLGQTQQAKKEMAAYIQSIPAGKAGDWTTCIAHFLAGMSNENTFLAQAGTSARRPTDIARQTGDALYYAGMQHLLAGDKAGALKRFKKSLKLGDDNSDNYTMARSIVGEPVSKIAMSH